MKVLDLGYENSYENFSITPICHIFSNFPAVFHHAQVTNRQILKHGFAQLWRTAHVHMLNIKGLSYVFYVLNIYTSYC